MKFRTASLSFSVVSLSLTNFVFAQNTANNEILVYPPKKPPTTKKWFLPLEYGEGRYTTGLYSGLNRFQRRRVNADRLDPFADRPKPTRKKESSSFKPGTWNWRPGRKPPAFSYKYKIINLTKDSQGSYEGMPGDYRQNYRPIPHVRFGGTFAPIPPLMGDPTQHRRGWYIKKYREKQPKKELYNKYIMDIVNDKIQESYPSLEWVTYSWKNPYKWKYNLTKDKVKPRFGSYEAFSNYDSRFPAYEPKRRYEVIKIPEALPIHKRSAEKEDTPGKADKSININSVPSKSEDVIRNLQSASSIMQSALRTAKLRQEPESVISSSDYDTNEALNSENSISLSSVYESSENNSSSSDTNSLINSEDLRSDIFPAAEDRMKMNKKSHNSDGKKSLLFNANRKQQHHMGVNNMRHIRHKRSPLPKESIDKLAKKLNLSPKKEESKWTFKNMPSETPCMSIFRLEDQPDSFWDSIYGRTKEKKGSGSSKDSDSGSNSESVEATMKPLITTMHTAPKAHPGIGLPQGVNEEPLMKTRGKGDRTRREKKKKKLTSEERQDKKRRKGRTNFARDYSIEVPREGADLKGMDALRFPKFPPQFTSFVPPRPYKQPTPYVQPTIPPRPPPRRPYVRIAEVQQGRINSARHTENNMFHLQNNAPHKVVNSVKARIIKDNIERVQSDMLHVQSKTWNKHITGSRVDHTKHKASVNKDSADQIESNMHNIKSSVYKNGKKKELFANIPHRHDNKGLHRSLGLPAARRRNLEHTLRFGDDRLYDSEEISENDKAEWSIGPPLNESEPVLNTEERNYVPEGAYQFPHFRNPNFDPDTAYDEHGVPIFMNPNYTEPTTLKGDRIFGLVRGMPQKHRLIGQHHNQVAHDLQSTAGNAKGTDSSSNIGKHVQNSQVKPDVMKKKWVMKRQKRFAHNGSESDDYEILSEPRHNPPIPQRVYHNDWESLELKPAPKGWPEPTLPVGGYKVHPDSAKMQYTYKPYVRRFIPEWIQKAEYHAFSTKYTLLPRHKNYFMSKKHHAPEQKKAEHDAFNAKIKSSEEISHSFNKKKKVSHLAWQHHTYVPRHTQYFETQNPRPPRKDGQWWNVYNEPFQRKKNKLPTRPTYKWKPWFAVYDPKPKSTRIPVTFRNYQSPVKFSDEPEVSESMTTKHKTYPPDFYIMPNASEYDYSVPGGWVDSEFEHKRFRGYRPPGVPFDSYYQDYYSEYADWYLKRRHNRSDDYYRIMDEEHGYNFTRRPHQRRRHSTKPPRPIVSMALKEFAEKMNKKFEKYLQQQFKNFPNTTNKNIVRDISAYLKAVKEDSLEMQTVGNIPFRLFHPPESFFHTSTREAIDTSSMERVLIHGLPAHPSEEAEMRRRRRRRMKMAVRNRMKMEKYKQQIKGMKDKIQSLKKKSQQTDVDLLEELKDDRSFIRQMKLEFMKKSHSKNVVTRLKDGFLKIGNMFGQLFRSKKPTNLNNTKIVTHKTKH